MLDAQQKGPGGITLGFEPFDSHVCDDVRAVSFDGGHSFFRETVRVVIETLVRQDGPVVITLGDSLEMVFAIEDGLVACLLEQLGEGLLVPVELVTVVAEAIEMAVFAAFDDGARGAADRVGAVAAVEDHALGGKVINVGCGVDGFQPSTVSTDGIGGVVICKDEDNVRSLVGSVRNAEEAEQIEEKDEVFHKTAVKVGAFELLSLLEKDTAVQSFCEKFHGAVHDGVDTGLDRPTGLGGIWIELA